MVSIRALREDDPRSGFRSGNEDLDRFFHRHAASNQFIEHIGSTYVAVDERGTLLGFVTLAAATISADAFPSTRKRRLPSYPLPALRLARLAVALEAQERGIGTLLIRYVFAQALEQANRTGCVGVLVDAKPDAVPFYEKYGFIAVDAVEGRSEARPAPTPMFLATRAIRMGLRRT